jgi:hypothetical protein
VGGAPSDLPSDAAGKVVMLHAAGEPEESLPYHIELWHMAEGTVERVLGDALNPVLAQAIYQEALREYPGRVITLRYGERIIARSDRQPGTG